MIKKIYTLLLCWLATATAAWATHIRAGEITVVRVSCSALTYEITFTGYEDTDSPVTLGPGIINFGDGNERTLDEPDFIPIDSLVAEGVRMRQFTVIHTYSSPGTYVVRFREFNRNEGVLNMTNSVGTPFYVESQIIIDPFLGCNNSPVLLVPPIDRAAKDIAFYHNPGAWDPDGDSLSYSLEICRQDLGVPVANYRFPNVYDTETSGGAARSEAGGAPIYKIDSVLGLLTWDAPFYEGEYNAAIRVDEWRKIEGQWRFMGYVIRDMQIIVEATENEPPELTVPPDTCIEAGTVLEAVIYGDDADGDPVRIDGFGGIFDPAFPGSATLSPSPARFQPVTAEVDFTWGTLCSHVRERPYEVQFRITDDPGNLRVPLTRYETWKVQVVAPAPKGVTAELLPGNRALIEWDAYDCGNASRLEVYRRVDSYAFDPTGCNVGIPEEAGYEMIGEVDVDQTSFVDNNNSRGLAYGATYCYRLLAVFPEPTGGESYASIEVCVTLEADAPVITEVSVEATDETNGEIAVSWLPPFDLDTVNYRYEVFRMTGLSGGADRTLVGSTNALTILDTGLDTENNPYHYEVVAYDEADIVVDTSTEASSVRALGAPLFQSIEVAWEDEVPWSNNTQEYPYHYVYRNRTDAFQLDSVTFELIDSVQVNENGFVYLDDGRFNGVMLEDTKNYCYYVITQGSYGNEKTESLDPLLNASQIMCAQPNDTVPPCPPVEIVVSNPDGSLDCQSFLADKPCGFSDFSNYISWKYPEEPECRDEIRGFNVYYSRTGVEGTFERIAYVEEPEFLHEDLSSFAGCYRISVIDRSGNESTLSASICRDNCPQYYLPDAFTINGDGYNEQLNALGDTYRLATGDDRCPRFVQSVHFKVFNRWGDKVYEYDTEEADGLERTIYLNWDGRSSNGAPLSEGAYYYLVEVTYVTLNPTESVEQIKGVVHIVR